MIELARQVALGAGEILVRKLKQGISIEHKGSIDLVTDADKASEKYVVDQLQKLFPSHGILGEEGSRIEGTSDLLWVIDPIDGTTNFAHGFPYFSVSLGLIKGNEAVLGVVYNPASNECFWAEKGSGAFLNGTRIAVSKQDKVQASLLATGFPYDVATTSEDNLSAYERVTKASQGVRCLGSAALDLCQVASGRIEAFWERFLHPWDIVAGSLIVVEAGGRISGCLGQNFNPLGHEICASNGLVHDELLGMIKG
ncbi:MAG: inositol monophosphatase [Firmicutes bacterium]|nr:inositol monophosphatase [Bacillota bacterium]